MEFHAAIGPYGNDLKMVSLDILGRVTESWKGCVSASWRRVLGSVGGGSDRIRLCTYPIHIRLLYI